MPVPPIGHEQQHWAPPTSVGCTRSERSESGAYRSAIPAEIAGLRLDLPAELVADSEDAGNGRTGRALVHLMLRSKRLVRTATVPISGGLLVGEETYFEALGAYRAGDAAPIVDELNHAALRSVHQGRQLVEHMAELRDAWRTTLRARSDSTVWKVLDLLPGHPVLDAETIARHTRAHAAGVRRSVAPLLEAGILVASQHFTSHKQLYRAPAVLDLLDEYAAEVGRRQR